MVYLHSWEGGNEQARTERKKMRNTPAACGDHAENS